MKEGNLTVESVNLKREKSLWKEIQLATKNKEKVKHFK